MIYFIVFRIFEIYFLDTGLGCGGTADLLDTCGKRYFTISFSMSK